MERNIAYIALFAALIAALGLVPKLDLLGGVPITAQSLGVMLCGAILGARRGALAVLLFLALVLLGLPLLAGGRGGLGILSSPTIGYLIGWPIGAFVTGLIVERMLNIELFISSFIGAIVGGIIMVYFAGIIGLMVTLDKSFNDALAINFIFIPGDVIKALLTAFIAQGLYAARPQVVLSRS
jgi:biotin transport system substrate-specific component